jgi:hypothetical protein
LSASGIASNASDIASACSGVIVSLLEFIYSSLSLRQVIIHTQPEHRAEDSLNYHLRLLWRAYSAGV